MPTEPPTTPRARHRQAEERRLRVGILHLGSLLGWDALTVARFVEGVTGRPLSRCERAQLRRVLEAYAGLARRVRATQARQPGAVCSDGGRS